MPRSTGRQPRMRGLKPTLSGVGRTLATILVVLILALVAEHIQPLQDLDAYLTAHPDTIHWLSWLTLGLTGIGVLLLVGTPLVVRVGDESYTDEVVDGTTGSDPQPSPQGGLSLYRFRGRQVETSFTDEASLSAVKAAWRQRAWRTSPRWLRFFLMLVGGLFITIGLFGYFAVIGPPVVKLLAAAALVYAGVRTAWAFRRA